MNSYPIFILSLCGVCVFSQIMLPPSITKEADELYRFSEDKVQTITLDCEAEGVPEVQYEWTINGEHDAYQNFEWVDEGISGSIRIVGAERKNEGWYQCFASNRYGKAMSKVTHIQEAVIRYKRMDEVVTKDAEIGASLSLTVGEITSIPAAGFQWSIAEEKGAEGKVIVMSRRITTDQKGNLHFASIVKEDRQEDYFYKLSVHNRILDADLGGNYYKINIQEESDGVTSLPKPMVPFNVQTTTIALVGTKIKLKCFYSGNPVPVVKWEYHLPELRVSLHDFDTVLEIDVQEEDHEKTIECYGENDNGDGEKRSFILDVKMKPVFETGMQPMNTNGTEGRTVVFKCLTQAKPNANVQWYIDGEEITANDPKKSNRLISDADKTLTITRLCKSETCGKSDLSSIQCNASNAYGYAFASVYMNVLLPTRITKFGPEKLEITSNTTSVSIQCLAEGDPSTPLEVQWLHNEIRIYVEDDSRFSIDAQNTLTIDFVGNEDSLDYFIGEYICKVITSAGEDSSSSFITKAAPITPAPIKATVADYWYVFVIVGVLLLILIIILAIRSCIRNTKYDYEVDENEKKAGYDALAEIEDDSFKNYYRPKSETGSKPNLLQTDQLSLIQTDEV